jgi:hypothetical protein
VPLEHRARPGYMGTAMNLTSRSRACAASAVILVAFGLVSAGCSEEKKRENVEGDAGAETGPQKPVLDGKLGAAVKAAESAQAGGSQAKDGPPENGMFAPGEADKALAPGAPAKLELLGQGAEPRVALADNPGDDEQRETISVGLRPSAQSGVINVDYGLVLKVDKPKDDKAKADKPKDDKKADPASPRSFRVAGKVASVTPGGALPKEIADQIAKIKGTDLHYQVGADGMVSDIGYALPKDADPGIETVVRALTEVLVLAALPVPQKPVGAGAYWMVTDRATTASGVDVVRYRVYHLDSVENGHGVLSVDIRQYAAKAEVDTGRGGQKLAMDRFDSQGKGKIEWSAAGLLPLHGELSERMQLAGHIATGQQGMASTELQAKMARADDKKK